MEHEEAAAAVRLGAVYLPADGFRKTSSLDSYTGPGRLPVIGRRGSMVEGELEASKRLEAGKCPAVRNEDVQRKSFGMDELETTNISGNYSRN